MLISYVITIHLNLCIFRRRASRRRICFAESVQHNVLAAVASMGPVSGIHSVRMYEYVFCHVTERSARCCDVIKVRCFIAVRRDELGGSIVSKRD